MSKNIKGLKNWKQSVKIGSLNTKGKFPIMRKSNFDINAANRYAFI